MDVIKELVFRISTSILLRLYLMISLCEIILGVIFVICALINYTAINDKIFQFTRGVYFIIQFYIGVSVSFSGIRGVNNDRPELLERMFYYNFYLVLYRITLLVILILDCPWYDKLLPIYYYNSAIMNDNKLNAAFGCVLAIIFNVFVAAMVRSCADTMYENQQKISKNNVTIPDDSMSNDFELFQDATQDIGD